MSLDSDQTTSCWMASSNVPAWPQLTTDLDCDVCIIGAGISGLTTAYLLAGERQRVVVLDEGPIARGETSRTTAHLSCEIDDYYFEIERIFGADGARLAYESHSSAIDTIERIVQEEKIDCS